MTHDTVAADATDALLLEEFEDRVVATINRPRQRNAIDTAVVEALHALCEQLERHPRVLILTGTNGVFASGADIREMRERTPAEARAGINAHAFIRIRELDLPVIAAVDGYALGGGAELAYAADIRIGTPRARFGNPETGLGIIASAGAAWRLPEIVGEGRATELLLTGRVIEADEALAIGLLSSVHAPDALLPAAHVLADRLGKNDRAAVIAMKKAIAAPRTQHPAIDLELQGVLFESPERQRRMDAFLEGRRD
ncbi:enoyl-CoA hydratase/isomerase family protein [Rathayibacter sp. YIM 133350]|uniref:enoyl-CoA hydratase/isomerase family protein n=1 Tax=Rathayibacter sp. YIM 133350 TaxID=3131992 RepID=UPI00307E6D65